METEEIFEKVKTVIVEQLGIDEANVRMESSFLEIPDEDVEKIVTVKDVVEYISENI
mgnify:CR=1 FL=1